MSRESRRELERAGEGWWALCTLLELLGAAGGYLMRYLMRYLVRYLMRYLMRYLPFYLISKRTRPQRLPAQNLGRSTL